MFVWKAPGGHCSQTLRPPPPLQYVQVQIQITNLESDSWRKQDIWGVNDIWQIFGSFSPSPISQTNMDNKHLFDDKKDHKKIQTCESK